MKAPALLLILAASLTFAQKADAPVRAKVADLLKDGAKWDKKVVAVEGTADDFKAKTSKAGNAYFTFDLLEGKESVHVYGFGKLDPEPKDGDRIRATGKFRVSKKLKDGEVKNEIDVSAKKRDEDAKPGVEILK